MELSLSYDQVGEYIKENYCEIDDDFCLREEIDDTLRDFYKQPSVSDKYKYLCSLEESVALSCLPHLPESFVNYYTVLGPDRLKANGYNISDVKKEYENTLGDQKIDIRSIIVSYFDIDEIYSKSDVKKKLKQLYDSIGYSKTPRASDLGEYFIIKNCMITNKETGKRDNCYKILAIKE